jgi:hypothetical protein
LIVVLKVGYFLPPKRFISWPYIIDILEGRKHLVQQNAVKVSIVPPKVKDLTIKKLWTEIKGDSEITKYFPQQCVDNDPPRDYFFAILSAIRPALLKQLIESAENSYWRKQEKANQTINVTAEMTNQLKKATYKQVLLNGPQDKRINLNRKATRADDSDLSE